MKRRISSTLAALLVLAPAGAHAQAPETGLWVGQAAIAEVTDLTDDGGGRPLKPTGGVATMRVLIHVNDQGDASLLKDVIVMRRKAVPNEIVLVTDPDLIPDFEPVVERKGKLAGLRFSSVAFEFDGDSFDLGAGFKTGGLIENKRITLTEDHPNNPYKHKFHPDHRKGFTLTRTITFTFAATSPDSNRPSFGTDWISGRYKEVITGLHSRPITIEGDLLLTKVSGAGVLNPAP